MAIPESDAGAAQDGIAQDHVAYDGDSARGVMSDLRRRKNEKELIFLDTLTRAAGAAMKRVDVAIDEDVLVLSGTVATFYLKQLAQETVRPLAIGLRIDNQIEVG